MKFAQLALISPPLLAKFTEEDLTEDITMSYPADIVHDWMMNEYELARTVEEFGMKFEGDHPHFEKKVNQWMMNMRKKYGKEAMAWFMSDSVQKLEAHKRMGWKQKEVKKLCKDAMTVVMEFAHGSIDASFTMHLNGTAEEHLDNGDMFRVGDEIYTVMEDLAAVIKSDWGAKKRELEAATLQDPALHKLIDHVLSDWGVEDETDMFLRVFMALHKLGKFMKPYEEYGNRIERILEKFGRLMNKVQRRAKFSDEPKMNVMHQWVMKHSKNPFEGIDWDNMYPKGMKKAMKKSGMVEMLL